MQPGLSCKPEEPSTQSNNIVFKPVFVYSFGYSLYPGLVIFSMSVECIFMGL